MRLWPLFYKNALTGKAKCHRQEHGASQSDLSLQRVLVVPVVAIDYTAHHYTLRLLIKSMGKGHLWKTVRGMLEDYAGSLHRGHSLKPGIQR